jgi:uncharacterized MAPEG superfamily protein
MTVPLWCLLALVVWIVWLVVALTVVRFGHLSSGGAVRDFGVPDDRRLIWRLYRAHQNALENVPLFGLVVLVITVRGVTGTAVDVLAIVYAAARIAHTLVHVAPGAGLPGNRRLWLLFLQHASLLGLVVLAALPGGP